jgi:hypothetical protein
MLLPFVTFDSCQLLEANYYLVLWGHKMGPVIRGNQQGLCHALKLEGKPVAIVTTHTLIRETVGNLATCTRANTVELSRLCADRPGLCRVVLRLWREFVFPNLGYQFAISYQDAALHSGNLYRFDGWTRAAFSHSGVDTRSGRPGRDKWVWLWSKPNELPLAKS